MLCLLWQRFRKKFQHNAGQTKPSEGQISHGAACVWLQITWPLKILTILSSYFSKFQLLPLQGLANFLCEGPDNKYFRLCRSLSVCYIFLFGCFSFSNNFRIKKQFLTSRGSRPIPALKNLVRLCYSHPTCMSYLLPINTSETSNFFGKKISISR